MKKLFLFSVLISLLICIGCRQTPQNKENKSVKGSVKGSSILKIDTVVKHIYVTFDDGPLEGSEDIDDAVRKEQIKVNVFVVGRHALSDSLKDFYKMYQNNHYIEIGNHSFSHAHNHYKEFYDNPSSVVADFMKCQTALRIPNKLARQPGRNQWRLKGVRINDVKSGTKSADMLYKQGFKVFGWDLEWQHDSKTGVPVQTVDDMVELIEKKLIEHKTVKANHLVLLAHDEMFRNGWEESELKQLIDELKAKGNYRFEHLSSYPD
jgi:peptidoglycan/xylan/chitin deacetylase (PgdA/CDA1 family)